MELVDGIKDYTLSVRISFEIKELNKRYITSGIFDNQYMNIDWGDGRVITDDIKQLKTCTIKITMELVDVYVDNKCVLRDFTKMLKC